MAVVHIFIEPLFKFRDPVQRDVFQIVIDHGIEDADLVGHFYAGIGALLQNSHDPLTQVKTGLCVCVQVRAELGKALQLPVLGVEQLQRAGYLFHSLDLGIATNTGNGNAGVHGGHNAGVEQLGLQEDLTVGDGDDVGGNVGRNVACLGLDDGQSGQTAAELAPLQYIAPYSGCAMAEYFMDKGKDVLIIYDDLSKHAVAYRALSLLIRRPPGREAYPGDVFYLHSRLLERSARVAPEYGGGSITALPIIETQAGDVSAYIPTNVISITDGQIFLESELFHSGVMPAVNPGISVSRVGGSAQIKAMKQVSGSLKLLYSQYRELQSFAQFGSDLDKDTKERLAQGERIVEVLKQDRNSPVEVAHQVCILYAVVNDYLKSVEVADIREFEDGLYEYMDAHGADVLDAIRTTGKMAPETEARLKEALGAYVEAFLKTKG